MTSNRPRLPRDEAERIFEAISEAARRRRRARLASPIITVAFATVVLGGSLIFALSRLADLGPRVRPGSQPACVAPSDQVELAVVKTASTPSFDKSCLAVPANREVVIRFTNRLSGSRDVSIYNVRPQCVRDTFEGGVTSVGCDPPPFFSGDPVNGPGTIEYTIGPLEPGTYWLQSDAAFETAHAILEVVETAAP